MSDDFYRRRAAGYMMLHAGAVGASSAASAVPLVTPGNLFTPLSLTRAQAGGAIATGLTSDNTTYAQYAADVPRFVGSARRLLIGGQRTNLLTNILIGATESVAVTAIPYVLTMFGTGSYTLSGAATGTLNGTGANNRVSLAFTPIAGTLTLTAAGSITWAQLEAATFASTPILPATTGPVTRGPDLISASLVSLGIPPSGACTVLWSGVLPQASPSGTNQVLFQLDDGSENNRYTLRNNPSTLNIVALRSTSGVVASSLVAGFTAGTLFTVGASIDTSGRIAASVNGGAVVAQTGGPTSALTTFRLGSISTTAGNLFGETARLSILPYALSDAALQAAAAAFPTS